MTDTTNDSSAACGQSALTDGLGTAVIVGGVVVAWFADFTQEASEWCTENHFGQWLVWRAKAPEIVPLTEAEYDEAMRKAAEFATLFEDKPEAPNVLADRREPQSGEASSPKGDGRAAG